MTQASDSRINDCGCCAGTELATPAAIENRPGLTALAYRVGTYASFRHSLLARLSNGHWPALRNLRTRDQDDFSVALLDAWAVVGDILTFYQERIANESHLSTATERRSILEQARLLGYQLGPGVAASTHLAFTMEEAPGRPDQAAKPNTLPVGTKVQSVPGPDELPQTFETIEEIEARVEWNAILPQLTEPQTLTWDMKEIWLEGATLNLAVGDVLLIIADEDGTKQAAIQRMAAITLDAAANRTRVALAKISVPPRTETSESVSTSPPGVYVMRAAPSPFGHNAPKEAIYKKDGTFRKFQEWDLHGERRNEITLSSRNDKLFDGSWIVIEQDHPDDPDGARQWIFASIKNITHLSMAKYGMAGNTSRVKFDAFWNRNKDSKLALLRSMTVNAQSEALKVAPLPVTYPLYGATISLNARIDGLLSGRPIAVTGKRQRLRITEAASQSPFESVELPGSETFPWIDKLEDALARPLLFLAGNERLALQPGDRLTLAAPPVRVYRFRFLPASPSEFEALLRASTVSYYVLSLVDRDGRTGLALLPSTWFALDPAVDSDETVREVTFIADTSETAITQDRDRTTLQLASPLAHVYDRATVRINANVAAATHGETVSELLGSGDATIPYQRFVLSQRPLTYVSANTATGSVSSLKVYVNDVWWEEVPFLFGHGPTDRIYVTQRDDEGRTTIRFGDGLTGARLPTGQNNVRAEYRKGTGLSGLVDAGKISQLLSRPLGLKDVANPAAPQGAEDPETRDGARKNAPLTVLTLDRAVSLQDYEDFSRAFAGIAKAQAVWVWDGRIRSVFLTVSGPDGQELDETGAVISSLKEVLRTYGDPFVAFTIKSYRKALFQVHGSVTVDADHVADTVLSAIHEDLRVRYAFDAREFGQPVALSQVVAAIQAVPGVVAVDIDKFYRTNAPVPALSPRLIADRPAMGADGLVAAAELLLLDQPSLTNLKVAL